MKNKDLICKFFALAIILVLIAAMALTLTSCGTDDETSSPAATQSEPKEIGEGATRFSLSVTGADKAKSEFVINTDKTTLGEALLEAGIITAEEQKTGFIKRLFRKKL